MGVQYSAEVEPSATWSIEKGYNEPLDLNYPKNLIGGITDDSYIFVLNQTQPDAKPLCDYFNGYKVNRSYCA